MAQDFAHKRKPASRRTKSTGRDRNAPPAPSRLRWYLGGVLTGVLLSFLAYLGTLPPAPGGQTTAGEATGQPSGAAEPQPPKPRFDFYTMLPDQTIDVEDDPEEAARARTSPGPAREYYLLQAGSFRQREDADRRRAELLLLGLEPRVEDANGDNGRWFRVYLGPFESRAQMARARSLTTAQDIDTLLLKRGGP